MLSGTPLSDTFFSFDTIQIFGEFSEFSEFLANFWRMFGEYSAKKDKINQNFSVSKILNIGGSTMYSSII